MAELKQINVTGKRLSKMLGVSGRDVTRLENSGVLVKVDAGIYDLGESIEKYIFMLKEKNSKLDDELKEKKIRKLDIEIEKLEGGLISLEESEEFFSKLIADIRAKLVSMPKQLMLELKDVEDPKEIEKIIKNKCYRILEDLAVSSSEESENEED